MLNHANPFFKFTVREPSDVDNDETTFKPEMSHQIFGEKYDQVKTLRINKSITNCIFFLPK